MSRTLILRSRNDRWSIKLNTRVLVVTGAVSYTHLTLPTTPYV